MLAKSADSDGMLQLHAEGIEQGYKWFAILQLYYLNVCPEYNFPQSPTSQIE